MRTIILAAATLALAGCGFYHWHKDGANNTAFQHDSGDCEQQTGTGGQQHPSGGQAQESAADPWQKCMTDRGWIYSSGW